jgi:hypothetical protein
MLWHMGLDEYRISVRVYATGQIKAQEFVTTLAQFRRILAYADGMQID